MGLSALRELAVVHPVELDDMSGATAAVDALNWLYGHTTAVVRHTDPVEYTTADGREVPNLVGIVRALPTFFEHRVFPVFVFDGDPVGLKRTELSARRKRRRRAAAKASRARRRGDERAAARHRAEALRITAPITRSTHELLSILDVPYVDAPTEAEAQAAHLCREGAADVAVTDDYDALLYGTPRTIRKFGSAGGTEEMDFRATLDRHAITWAQLVDVAILCGTDYNQGLRGFTPERALAAVKAHGDLEGVLADVDASVENADRIRAVFLDPQVTDDCAFDRTISPDLDAARAYVTETWEIPDALVAPGFERLAVHADAFA